MRKQVIHESTIAYGEHVMQYMIIECTWNDKTWRNAYILIPPDMKHMFPAAMEREQPPRELTWFNDLEGFAGYWIGWNYGSPLDSAIANDSIFKDINTIMKHVISVVKWLVDEYTFQQTCQTVRTWDLSASDITKEVQA